MARFHRSTQLLGLLSALSAGCAPFGGGAPDEDGLPPFGGKGDLIDNTPSTDLARRFRGQSEFVSQGPRWHWGPIYALNETATKSGQQDSQREVEEADIYRRDGDRLYILNAYRGLQIVDVTNPDAPAMLGRANLDAYPHEMFVRGTNAYVLLNSFDRTGAVLRVIDVADATNPITLAEFEMAGWFTATRLLSTADGSSAVVYVATQEWGGLNAQGPTTHISAIDITNAAAPVLVDDEAFAGSGFNVHVTPEAFFLAGSRWENGETTTSIQYVDISDLRGDVAVRGAIELEGSLSWGDRGDLQLDYHDGFLRVASQIARWTPGNAERKIRVQTIDTANPDALKIAGELDVGHGESLVAARFEGEHAFLFHMTQVDPLEIIDLSVPSAPRSLSILEIPGWVDHIQVHGTKLLTLGVDSASPRRVAVMVFDVTDPTAGESWAWTTANYDLKSFTVLDDEGLVLLPIGESRNLENGGWEYRQWTQLFSLDLANGSVATRGTIEDSAGTRRALAANGRVLTFSDLELQVANVANPDAPYVTARLELARDVQDFKTIGGFGVMLVGKGDGWQSRAAELRVVSLHDPDNTAPLATLELRSPAGSLLQIDDRHLALLGTDYASGESLLTVVNFDDPVAPRVLGAAKLPTLGYTHFGRKIWWRPTPTVETVLAGEALVAFTFAREGEEPGGKLRVVSLRNRAFPHESAVVDLGAGTVVDMRALGSKVYVSSYAPEAVEAPVEPAVTPDLATGTDTAVRLLPGGSLYPRIVSPRVKYFLHIVDVSTPDAPVVSQAINVPGTFAGLTTIDGWEILFTTDRLFTSGEEYGMGTEAFDAMTLAGDRVRLLDVYGLPAGAGKVMTAGAVAAYATSRESWLEPVLLEDGTASETTMERPSELVTLDLSWPDTVRKGAALPLAGDWSELRAIERSYAFVSSYNALNVVDVSSATAPTTVATFQLGRGWWNDRFHFASDGRLYVPNGLYGLDVYSTR